MARLLLHVADDLRVAVDPERISHVHAHGELSRVVRPGEASLDDTRKLGALAVQWKGHGLLRIHETALVNPRWVAELRRQPASPRDWELRLADPDATRLEVEREYLPALWAAFGER